MIFLKSWTSTGCLSKSTSSSVTSSRFSPFMAMEWTSLYVVDVVGHNIVPSLHRLEISLELLKNSWFGREFWPTFDNFRFMFKECSCGGQVLLKPSVLVR